MTRTLPVLAGLVCSLLPIAMAAADEEENKTMVRRFIQEVVNTGDLTVATKTGVPPCIHTQLAEAMNENGVVMTSSPGSMPSALMSRCNPAVPLEHATAWRLRQ